MITSLALASWAKGDYPPQPPELHPLRYAEFSRMAARYDQVIVWEGLPHPLFEKSKRTQEEKARKTYAISDQLFYALPLSLQPEEANEISAAALEHRENFLPWSGMKLCGGFHADYALEWRRSGQTLAQALFCFGCEEARFIVGSRTEEVDLSKAGYAAFRILFRHRTYRPPFTLPPTPKPQFPPPLESTPPPAMEVKPDSVPILPF